MLMVVDECDGAADAYDEVHDVDGSLAELLKHPMLQLLKVLWLLSHQ